jgi:hypothetical protein
MLCCGGRSQRLVLRAAAAQIDRVDREPLVDELLGAPAVTPALRVEAGAERDDGTGLAAGRHERLNMLGQCGLFAPGDVGNVRHEAGLLRPTNVTTANRAE